MIESPTLSSTSSDLLTLIRRHDPDGWARFVQLYGPLVYGWCRRAGLESHDAGDLTQEVFAAVFGAVGEFRHARQSDTFRGWLRTICRNKVHDHFRRRAASPAAAAGGTDAHGLLQQTPELPDDEATALTDRQALVRRAAESVRGEFEDRTWRAFWRVAVELASAADAAAELGMTVGAVRQAKYAVLRRLREVLAGEFD